MLTVTAGCKRIPMFTANGRVYLELDLDTDLKINLSGRIDFDASPQLREKARGNIPTDMKVLFYDTKLHTVVYETFLPAKGGFIDIEPGVYDVLVYGLGTDYTRVIGLESRGTAHAYTDFKSTAVFGTKAGDEEDNDDNPDARIYQYRVITEPDQIYVGRAQDLVVPTVPEGEDNIIHLHMTVPPLVQSWTFIAYNINGLERVKDLTCYITGQATSRYFWDQHFPTQPVVAVDFPCVVNQDDYTVETVFNTFGKIPEYTSKAIMYVRVQDNYNNYYQWQYDVTEQFNNPDNVGHEIIVTDPIEIPDDPSGGAGNSDFNQDVNPWKPEIIDIDVN